MPLINKPTRVTGTNATAIDHILTNAFLNKQIKMGIIKDKISDHFSIFLIADPITSSEKNNNNKRTHLYKRIINTTTTENFKNISTKKPGILSKKLTIIMKPIATFCSIVPHFMRKVFQNQKSRLKKNLISPWITKGIMKSSKQKQNLYNKFLKSRTKEKEAVYKAYKNLFEAIRKKLKRKYYSELFAKY